MIKTTLFSITAAMALATAANASIVTMSAGFTGPFAFKSDGTTRVSNGLIRVGTLSGDPATTSVDDINAVFQEFGTATTSATGGLGGSVSNPDAGSFDGQQVYIWVFDGASEGTSADYGLFTVLDKDAPTTGNPWVYPTHTGSGTDSVTISLGALVGGGGRFIIPESSAQGGNVVLAPIPEPSGTLLAGLASMVFVLRRRR